MIPKHTRSDSFHSPDSPNSRFKNVGVVPMAAAHRGLATHTQSNSSRNDTRNVASAELS